MRVDDRLRHIVRRLSESPDSSPTGNLCRVGAEISEATGAGIVLLVDDVLRASVCATDGVSARLEELQLTHGEGPCVDAFRDQQPAVEPDLLTSGATTRWPAFTGPAVDAGARAVFGFPMTVEGSSLGALHLYRDASGGLTDNQHADTLVLADLAGRWVLGMQATAAPDQLPAGLDVRSVVHQASGVLAAQLDVSIAGAQALLRAHAVRTGQPLSLVAEAVVDHRLRVELPEDTPSD